MLIIQIKNLRNSIKRLSYVVWDIVSGKNIRSGAWAASENQL
jgi:hypothetical protein